MSDDLIWRERLMLTRDARTDSTRSDLARRAQRGELVRVATGAYLPADLWAGFGARDRYLARICILAARATDPITFSHASAAAIWGLPWFGSWPDEIDVIRSEPARGHHAAGVRRHLARGRVDAVEIHGLSVTSLARTAVDIAGQPGLIRAVVVGDAVVNHRRVSCLAVPGPVLTTDDLRIEAETSSRARARALSAIEFLDGRSDSPGESISRVSMWRAGLPAPMLQQKFAPWVVDFWWPEYGVIGEFDGAMKYLDPATLDGRSPGEVVFAEKRREDALRRRVEGFARWGYAESMSPRLLADRLKSAGVPAVRRARFAAVSAF